MGRVLFRETNISDIDRLTEDFIAYMTSPPRRRHVSRVAEPLRHLEPEDLQTPMGKVAAWRLGDGPAVMLVHGFEDDNALWTPMLDMLAARGRAAVVLDLPGHGLSADCDNPIAAAPAALRAVAAALGPVDAIVGHSLGGWAAAQAAADGLAVKRLVLIGAPFETSVERWRRTAIRYGFDADFADKALARHSTRAGPELRAELAAILPALSAPVLVVHSRDDERATFDAAERACGRSSGVQLVELTDAGHRESAQHVEALAAAVMFCDFD